MKIRKITAREIKKYAKISRFLIDLRKTRASMRGDFLKRIEDGADVDVDGEYILNISAQNRIDSDQFTWKMYATQLAIQLCNNDVSKGMAMIAVAEATAPRKKVPVVTAKINEMYGELSKDGSLRADSVFQQMLKTLTGLSRRNQWKRENA